MAPDAAGSSRPADLVFGVLAHNPACGGTLDCAQLRTRMQEGLHMWVRSVRAHTDAAHTEVMLFTGRGNGSLLAHAPTAAWLRERSVRVLEADYADSDARVAHRDRKLHVWCVNRNRWFVIRDFLQTRASRYRFVLMSDTRDAVLQADPFGLRTPSGGLLLDRAMVFSGEGAGAVRTLRQSKKGMPRTLRCARGVSEAGRARLLDTEIAEMSEIAETPIS